jgi:type I restriction enzyme, R subunit
MPYNEADTRAKLIDPALRQCGWTEDLVFREQTAGSIVLDGRRARRLAGRIDYLLRVRVNPGTQPVPLALIEAKAESRTRPWAGTGANLCAPLQRAVRLFE